MINEDYKVGDIVMWNCSTSEFDLGLVTKILSEEQMSIIWFLWNGYKKEPATFHKSSKQISKFGIEEEMKKRGLIK